MLLSSTERIFHPTCELFCDETRQTGWKDGWHVTLSHPMMANAGSSCRSKGKSMRKFVLNRAVMVTGRWRKDGEWIQDNKHPVNCWHRWNIISVFWPPHGGGDVLTVQTAGQFADGDGNWSEGALCCPFDKVLHTNPAFQSLTGSTCTCVFVEDGQHSEYEGTERSGKVSPPVVPHCKVRGRYLDTEQHTWREKNKGPQIRKGSRLRCQKHWVPVAYSFPVHRSHMHSHFLHWWCRHEQQSGRFILFLHHHITN